MQANIETVKDLQNQVLAANDTSLEFERKLEEMKS